MARVLLLPSEKLKPIASQCRVAVLQFLYGVERGWGPRNYSHWLVGPYREVTRHAAPRTTGRSSDFETVRAREHDMSPELFVKLMRDTHKRVLSTFEAAAPPRRDVDFAIAAVCKGFVVRALDEAGAVGWIPVDVRDSWPVDRLLSLMAADYLTRPSDYEHACVAPLAMLRLRHLA